MRGISLHDSHTNNSWSLGVVINAMLTWKPFAMLQAPKLVKNVKTHANTYLLVVVGAAGGITAESNLNLACNCESWNCESWSCESKESI